MKFSGCVSLGYRSIVETEADMNIREFNGSAADYDTAARIITTVWPDRPVTAHEIRESDTERKPEFVRRSFFAEQGEQPAAVGTFEHRPNMYHPQSFWMHLNVLPPYRKQGIGSSLYEHMLAVLQSEYRANELHASTMDHWDFSIRFLQKCGFREIKRQWETHLNTATFDFSLFSAVEAKMKAAGIEIKPLSELIYSDADCLRKVYELHQMLVQDIPSPRARTRIDFENWLGGYSSDNPSFILDANFIALHRGEYVGMTSLWGNPATDRLYTGMTGVKREYRRQGIATALKLRGIIYARNLGNRILITGNKNDNPMLELNLKLGFVKQSAEVMFMKELHAAI